MKINIFFRFFVIIILFIFLLGCVFSPSLNRRIGDSVNVYDVFVKAAKGGNCSSVFDSLALVDYHEKRYRPYLDLKNNYSNIYTRMFIRGLCLEKSGAYDKARNIYQFILSMNKDYQPGEYIKISSKKPFKLQDRLKRSKKTKDIAIDLTLFNKVKEESFGSSAASVEHQLACAYSCGVILGFLALMILDSAIHSSDLSPQDGDLIKAIRYFSKGDYFSSKIRFPGYEYGRQNTIDGFLEYLGSTDYFIVFYYTLGAFLEIEETDAGIICSAKTYNFLVRLNKWYTYGHEAKERLRKIESKIKKIDINSSEKNKCYLDSEKIGSYLLKDVG